MNLPAAITGSLTALLLSVAAAADPWPDVRPRPELIIGTLSCTSASCHGGTESGREIAGLSPRQYVHWLVGEAKYAEGRRHYDPRARLDATDADPHAIAAQRILEPRFQEVLRRASLRADGSNDPAMYQRCAHCHDPLAVHSTPHAPREEFITRSARNTIGGIGCESCHGGGRDWLALHYERGISREQLTQLGMIDTKNLFVRARQCATCHVGSSDNDMNHDMIAAGHPPLRFELASYEALLPRKHWDDRPRRIAEPDYEVQLWAAGRIAAADAALALLESRARRASDFASGHGTGNRGQQTAPWPEFAESNCFACHQPLRTQARQSLADSKESGRLQAPSWRTWDVALSPLLVSSRQLGFPELPPPSLPLVDALGRLSTAIDASLSPSPDEIAELAAGARTALHQQVRIASTGGIRRSDGSPLDAATILRELSSPTSSVTWDDACQRVAALIAAERSLHERGLLAAPDHDDLLRRIKSISASLRFESSSTEWPAAFSASAASFGDVAREIDHLRDRLATIAAQEAAR